MKINPFLTEQFFSEYEFTSPHMLASSDCETLSIQAVLEMAGATLADLADVTLGYTESQGNPELRALIATMYSEVRSEDVVVLTSPVEGIYLAMQTLLEPGDEVVALRPAYDALTNVARHVCHRVVPWDFIPTEKSWALDFDHLEALITDQTKMIVVNFPHNPTGFLPTENQFAKLVSIAERHGVWLFCDEIYRGLEFGQAIPSAADVYEKSITLSGLSKTYGLPGLRAGWVVIRDSKMRDELINWKHYTTICPAAPTEFLAIHAIKIRNQLADRSKSIIQGNLKLCDEFFSHHHDLFTWRPPIAGSVGFAELNLDEFGFGSATEYCHYLAKQRGVVLLPGECLGYADRFVRLGLGRKSFESALHAFAQVLRQDGNGTRNNI